MRGLKLKEGYIVKLCGISGNSGDSFPDNWANREYKIVYKRYLGQIILIDVMDLESGKIYKELGTNCVEKIIKK